MKLKFRIYLSALVASSFSLSALAQDPAHFRPDGYTHPFNTRRMDRLNDAARASDLIGMTVRNYQDQKLGKVDDLAVEVESGRIVQVILSTGGTLTAVPPGALQHDLEHKALLLDADKEKLRGAPKFEMSKWAECSESNHLSEVYRYYGEKPYFMGVAGEYGTIQDSDLKRYQELPKNTDGTASPDTTKTVEQSRDAEVIRRVEGNGSWSRLGYIEKASKLKGTPVRNLQDEKLGKVENLLVDLPSGRIVTVIIASGGFMGMRDELSAVPPSALRFNPNHDTLQLDATKETLALAPHFKPNQWPDFGRPEYTGRVYRAYQVEPYFSSDLTYEAGNAPRSAPDRDGRALTPMDQGNSQADIDITSRIRKEIIADNRMSLSAKNVKIITVNGRVTLRGAVNNDAEKRVIGEIADEVARAANVDNQLEVAVNNSNRN